MNEACALFYACEAVSAAVLCGKNLRIVKSMETPSYTLRSYTMKGKCMKCANYMVALVLACSICGCKGKKAGSIQISSEWTIADENFLGVASGVVQPKAKTAYVLLDSFETMKISYVTKMGLNIVNCLDNRIIVKSDAAYVDNQTLNTGLYAYIGVEQIEVGSIPKTLHAFAQVVDDQARGLIKGKLIELENRRHEEEKRIVAERAKTEKMKLEAERARLQHERELEEARARIERENAEKRKALEAEQKQIAQRNYARYAEQAFSSVSFDYNEYVVIDAAIAKISEISVDEVEWNKLREAVAAKDYLLALGLMANTDRLAEYPSPDVVRRLISEFSRQRFHLRLRFRNKKTCDSFGEKVLAFGYWCDCDNRSNKLTPVPFFEESGSENERVFAFGIDERVNYLILRSNNSISDLWHLYSNKTYQIECDERLSQEEKLKRIGKENEEFLSAIHAKAMRKLSDFQIRRFSSVGDCSVQEKQDNKIDAGISRPRRHASSSGLSYMYDGDGRESHQTSNNRCYKYTVQSGDTLNLIAVAFGTTTAKIKKLMG